MFDFQWPWFALLLPLPLLVKTMWRRRPANPGGGEDAVRALLHPALTFLDGAFARAPASVGPRRLVRALLFTLMWASLVGALMRPQWLEEYTEVKSLGYDLMLAVDASRSMEALDFTVGGRQVPRMAVVKGVVTRFIQQRQGDRVGLIMFGDNAYVLSPMTLDAEAVGDMLQNAVPRMAGDATAIGDAIGLAVKKLRERPEGSRVLILVTDGENTAGSLPPLEAARLARQYDIRIYAIGVGTKGLVPFREDGRMTMTRMEIDEDLLRAVAQETGGSYFRATDTEALEEIYSQINDMEKTEAESRSLMVPEALYRWPLAAAMLALLLLGLSPRALGET
jgi:Ca-activated chloride channel family protein